MNMSSTCASAWPSAADLTERKKKRPLSPTQYTQNYASKRTRRPELELNCEVQYGSQPVLLTYPSPSPLQLSPYGIQPRANESVGGHTTSVFNTNVPAAQILGATNWAQYSDNLQTQWSAADPSYCIDPKIIPVHHSSVQSAHSLFSCISSELSIIRDGNVPFSEFDGRTAGSPQPPLAILPNGSDSVKDLFISRTIQTLSTLQQAISELLETVDTTLSRDASSLGDHAGGRSQGSVLKNSSFISR